MFSGSKSKTLTDPSTWCILVFSFFVDRLQSSNILRVQYINKFITVKLTSTCTVVLSYLHQRNEKHKQITLSPALFVTLSLQHTHFIPNTKTETFWVEVTAVGPDISCEPIQHFLTARKTSRSFYVSNTYTVTLLVWYVCVWSLSMLTQWLTTRWTSKQTKHGNCQLALPRAVVL